MKLATREAMSLQQLLDQVAEQLPGGLAKNFVCIILVRRRWQL